MHPCLESPYPQLLSSSEGCQAETELYTSLLIIVTPPTLLKRLPYLHPFKCEGLINVRVFTRVGNRIKCLLDGLHRAACVPCLGVSVRTFANKIGVETGRCQRCAAHQNHQHIPRAGAASLFTMHVPSRLKWGCHCSVQAIEGKQITAMLVNVVYAIYGRSETMARLHEHGVCLIPGLPCACNGKGYRTPWLLSPIFAILCIIVGRSLQQTTWSVVWLSVNSGHMLLCENHCGSNAPTYGKDRILIPVTWMGFLTILGLVPGSLRQHGFLNIVGCFCKPWGVGRRGVASLHNRNRHLLRRFK